MRYNVFNKVEFVKQYLDDKKVNGKNNLSVENAEELFVKYFILSERVRYEVTWKYKFITFMKNRFYDSLRQIPINATRYFVEYKCF